MAGVSMREPILFRAHSIFLSSYSENSSILPLVFSVSPVISRIRVVLPAPLSPIRP